MNYKFIQPVSMQVTKEQYERDLREPLLMLGYKEDDVTDWDESEILVTNFNGENEAIGIVADNRKNAENRHFIPEYNPQLFLAIAAMTKGGIPIVREWFVYTDYVVERAGYKVGVLYKNENPLINARWKRKATLQELIDKFTNKKQDIMKEITNEQFNELKNLIAPENVEKFNKLFKVNKNAIKEDLDFYIDFGTPDIEIAKDAFSCDSNFLPFRENYRLRSLWVKDNIDIHIIDGEDGDKLIMFNEKEQ